jgi:hypothetical protein
MSVDMDWAVRVAKLELEREALQERLDGCQEGFRNYLGGHGFTLFGEPPEYWLDLRRALQMIGTECENYTGSLTCVMAGRKRGARYSADAWCRPCIAREALKPLRTAHETVHEPRQTHE